MTVCLLNYTPDPDRAVAVAARLCYAEDDGDTLHKEMTPSSIQSLIHNLLKSGHHSAFEHANFTFSIANVSRVLTHQLVRHRLASYNQQSQRYVNFGAADSFIEPPALKNSHDTHAVFSEAVENARNSYNKLVALGISQGRTREEAQEDARFVLPNAAATKIVVTMNARELRHFFTLRCCNRAQWEIRQLAWAMRGFVLQVSPTIFLHSGPGCVTDKCPEGKMTCGTPYPKKFID